MHQNVITFFTLFNVWKTMKQSPLTIHKKKKKTKIAYGSDPCPLTQQRINVKKSSCRNIRLTSILKTTVQYEIFHSSASTAQTHSASCENFLMIHLTKQPVIFTFVNNVLWVHQPKLTATDSAGPPPAFFHRLQHAPGTVASFIYLIRCFTAGGLNVTVIRCRHFLCLVTASSLNY